MINDVDVQKFIESWKDGLFKIRNIYDKGGDYKSEAILFIEKHYLFGEESVLFKPTMTRKVAFRNNLDDALSYFIGGGIEEDKGFALTKWKSIEIDEMHTAQIEEGAIVMGKLCFTSDEKLDVAFTFVLKSTNDILKIKAHHSSQIK